MATAKKKATAKRKPKAKAKAKAKPVAEETAKVTTPPASEPPEKPSLYDISKPSAEEQKEVPPPTPKDVGEEITEVPEVTPMDTESKQVNKETYDYVGVPVKVIFDEDVVHFLKPKPMMMKRKDFDALFTPKLETVKEADPDDKRNHRWTFHIHTPHDIPQAFCKGNTREFYPPAAEEWLNHSKDNQKKGIPGIAIGENKYYVDKG